MACAVKSASAKPIGTKPPQMASTGGFQRSGEIAASSAGVAITSTR